LKREGFGPKQADGFTTPLPTVLTAVSMIGCAVLAGPALKHIPVATGYAGQRSAPWAPRWATSGFPSSQQQQADQHASA